MRKLWYAALLLPMCMTSAHSQLTPDQRMSDFLNLAGLYAKEYAPYEWKMQAFGYDLLQLKPWMDRLTNAKDDLDFYDVCSRYVSSLKSGGHDRFLVPSTFVARLGFTVDIYDGKTLVDSINRGLLPAASFPFQIGDELVSVDGKTTDELITELMPYGIVSNPGSARRSAAGMIPTRTQQAIPRAVDLGSSAVVMIRRQSGALESYTIPWVKSGTPLVAVGPVPGAADAARRKAGRTGVGAGADEPDYLAPLHTLQNIQVTGTEAVLGSGALAPIFAMPDGFVQRLGQRAGDEFFTGTFKAGGYTIGFLRIPSFAPGSQARALQQLDGEVAFFQANTDGLVVDDMRNPGGSVNYLDFVAQRLIPTTFRVLGYEVRATSGWIASFANSVDRAKAAHADQATIDQLQAVLDAILEANSQSRGRTGPIPVDGPSLFRDPAMDADGKMLAYTKPLMVLADEFSGSGGDAFPATVQDNGRGPIFGMRTMGAGGSVSNVNATAYSEAVTRVTQSLMNRKNPIVTDDLPTAPYVENIGVRPDIVADYMTLDNLLNHGQTFVAAFTDVIVKLIQQNQ